MAALGRAVVADDLGAVDVPALARGVHLHRDRRARREAGREQLLGTRGLVAAANLLGLVGLEAMLADLDGLAEWPPASRDGFHRPWIMPKRGTAVLSAPWGRRTSTSAAC